MSINTAEELAGMRAVGLKVFLGADGWTVETTDGGMSAHYEHTLVITNDEPILLTAA
jgi:methionine aminopeptidase